MDITGRIAGADKLVTVFGNRPSFHDAEVVWVRLDRRPHGQGDGPTLEALVHAFAITGEVGPDAAGLIDSPIALSEVNSQCFNAPSVPTTGVLVIPVRRLPVGESLRHGDGSGPALVRV